LPHTIRYAVGDNRIDITLDDSATSSLWWATKNEWLGLLDVAGLELEVLFGNFDRQPLDNESRDTCSSLAAERERPRVTLPNTGAAEGGKQICASRRSRRRLSAGAAAFRGEDAGRYRPGRQSTVRTLRAAPASAARKTRRHREEPLSRRATARRPSRRARPLKTLSSPRNGAFKATRDVTIAVVSSRERKRRQPGLATDDPAFVGWHQLVRGIQGS